MNRLLTTLCLLLCLTASMQAADRNLVGMNEDFHANQYPEQRLKNLARRSRGWTNDKLGITKNDSDLFELGDYTLTWTGSGDPTIDGAILKTPESNNSKTKVFTITSHDDLFIANPGTKPDSVSLVYVNPTPNNPLSDPHRGSFKKQAVYNAGRFDITRSMNLTRTNGSTQTTWASRPTLDGYLGQWTDLGWPWELVIEFSNICGTNPWICIPHMADDNYVVQLAQMVDSDLSPVFKIYVEFANEPWNSSFGQYSWIQDNLVDGTADNRHKAYGRRAAQVINLFKANAPNTEVIGVLAGNATAPGVFDDVIAGSALVSGFTPDAISCSTYFNPAKEELSEGSGTYLFDDFLVNGENETLALSLIEAAIATRVPLWNEWGAKAANLSVPLIAYEGGIHLAAKAGGVERNNAAWVDWLHDLNRHANMPTYYDTMRTAWYAAGGSDMVYYSRVRLPVDEGSFGHQDYHDDDLHPKNIAVEEHIQETFEALPDILVIPDGGWSLGGGVRVNHWQSGKDATMYDGNLNNQLVVTLDEPVTFPATVSYDVVRFDIDGGPPPNLGPSETENRCEQVGICDIFRFQNATGLEPRAHCDQGEEYQRAGRSRLLGRDPDDNSLIGLQNGSTPAASINPTCRGASQFQVGYWHRRYDVFDPYGPGRSLDSYLDDNTLNGTASTIQAVDSDVLIPTNFTKITIGLARGPTGNYRIAIRNLKITPRKLSTQEMHDDAVALGYTYRGWDEVALLQSDGRAGSTAPYSAPSGDKMILLLKPSSN